MALYYDLPVYKDVYRLILKIFEYTKDFSREYKYTLVEPGVLARCVAGLALRPKRLLRRSPALAVHVIASAYH